MIALLIIFCVAFGPAALLIGIRIAAGPRAARATWRLLLRWLYLVVIGAGGISLIWWAKVDGVEETDTAVLFGIACMQMIVLAFSGALSWTVANTRWIRMDAGTKLR